ncbi:hypothetical protein LTR04_005469 [Oleoguttula sp. CCFEE 6159]|nr:hypothetical protein LTR04_005469 [Oleoguttula sp. CCFEE 6159]
MSRGREGRPVKVIKPQKKSTKSGTASSRKFRFESFSKRISKLTIDPIRRARRNEVNTDGDSEVSSYFKTAFEEWKDLNLSEQYTNFSREVAPLCESLTQVVYYQDRIMDILIGYIAKQDANSLKPLLDLLAHFAHDLQDRFDKHFERAVATICRVAADHADAEVIEWSFNCLAWLFKYLSRLLVPDLRPLYDLMAPMLGKTHQKPFITRFAAEAMSFLMRKAGAVYHRDHKPLDDILAHIMVDHEKEAAEHDVSLYQQGIQTLLVESMKGVQRGLHSSGQTIFQRLLSQALSMATDASNADVSLGVVDGVLVSLIHHTDAETFKPILDTILDDIPLSGGEVGNQSIHCSTTLLFTAVGVRKGSRILQWGPVLDKTAVLVETTEQGALVKASKVVQAVLAVLAVVLHTAPLDAVIPYLRLLNIVAGKNWEKGFLSFCHFLAELDIEKFRDFVLPHLQRFIVAHWEGNEKGLCLLLPKFAEHGCFDRTPLQCPVPWQQHVLNSFHSLSMHEHLNDEHLHNALEDLVCNCNGYLRVMQISSIDAETRGKVTEALLTLLRNALKLPPSGSRAVFETFALSNGFKFVVENTEAHKLDSKLWPSLCTASTLYGHLPTYWAALLGYTNATITRLDLKGPHVKVLVDSIMKCLGAPSHRLRSVALEVLKVLFVAVNGNEPDGLLTAILIEKDKTKGPLSDFECSNLNRLTEMFRKSTEDLKSVKELLQWLNMDTVEPFINASSRSQALRVLNEMPQIAEKRSRSLVPVLLQWIAKGDTEELLNTERTQTVGVQSESTHWSRKDQKAMLAIFAQFTNPRVLYKAVEVYDALLSLLANGDVEIQKSALKAILTWRSPGILNYEEHLVNILDDARFREEVSVFLNVGQDDSVMQQEHHDELIPVLLRLLYGRVISRAGSASGKRGQESRRKAVFVALARFGQSALGQYLDIALGPLANVSLLHEGTINGAVLSETHMAPRKQYGTLNMLQDMLETLGVQLAPFAQRLTDSVLYCLINASRDVRHLSENSEGHNGSSLSILKSIRQAGFHCLHQLFITCTEFQWDSYAPLIVEKLIEPRLQKLSIETAQSVSGVLRLLSAWSSSLHTAAFLVDYSSDLLVKVAECLTEPSARDEVKLFILNKIIKNIVKVVADAEVLANGGATKQREHVRADALEKNANAFLVRIGELLRGSPSKDVLEACIQTVSQLAPFVAGSVESRSLIEISVFLLGQPSRRVNPATKSEILKILSHFVPRHSFSNDHDLHDQAFNEVTRLFSFFQDNASRQLLCQVFGAMASKDDEIKEIAVLCEELNSFSLIRLDESDFDRRSKAFNVINEERYLTYSAKQWRALIFNMLYYIKDNDELAIRTSASFALRRFVEAASAECNTHVEDFKTLIALHVLPALHNGARDRSELVRTEYLAVMAHIVKHFPTWSAVSDMHVLLVSDDEEASFFTNVLHIQQHRRLRALRRLAGEAKSGHLSSGNVSQFFIPLIEHFIFDKSDDESAHNLAAETTSTIGALSEWLEWSQYRAMLRRFVGYIQSKPYLEKSVIRLLGVVIDGLYRAGQLKGYISQEAAAALIDASQQDEEAEVASAEVVASNNLSKTMPSQAKLSDDLIKNMLPPLTGYLHRKDESTVSLRVPVAVAVVKLLRILPSDEFAARLPPVLMDISHILRSRAQDSRDMTRKTLAEISTLIGPAYFGFVLKELRSALQRGYQLHVLSFTVHSILVSTSPTFKPGDLDYCLPDIVAVIMDDIFGVTGQEKDAEDYISKMKEVKSSKSFDSMELVAKTTTLRHLVNLVRPIQALLLEKLDLKTAKKIDELLRRIGLGLTHNEAVNDRDILIFCYEVMQEIYKTNDTPMSWDRDENYRTKRYLISMKTTKNSGNRGATTSHSYKMVRFSLDLLRSVLHKHDELQTPTNIAGFMPIIGDALVQVQEEVQISAIRLLIAIIKVPLAEIDSNAAVYVSEAVRIIKAAPSTNSELSQAALKLISAVLRERRSVTVKEGDLAYLLKRLRPDLEEPDRQGVTFNFLKAVMSRKIIITEVYEVLDTIATIMVTNQARTARDLARGVYFQFLMEYPQAKDRLQKQLTFLIKNLEYKYVEGRQSVMELVHLLLSKVGDTLIQDMLGTFFLPLVMVRVNDDSSGCREMAGALIKKVFERADGERMKSFLSTLRTCLQQTDNDLLTRVALQCWTLYFDVKGVQGKDIRFVVGRLTSTLTESTEEPDTDKWEAPYYALQTVSKLCELAPSTALSADLESLWVSIRACQLFPHAWVKLSAAKLLGVSFADFASTNAKAEEGLQQLPLVGSAGLEISGEDMLQLASASLRALRAPNISQELATQTVKNLVFLGRCFGANGLRWRSSNNEAAGGVDASDEDDDQDDITATSSKKSALQHLFERLSAILRRETSTTRGASLHLKTASLQLVASLCTTLPNTTLAPSLPTLLLPLHNLTDASIAAPTSTDPSFTDAYKSLTSTAQEVLALLQKKLGTTAFVAAMQAVQKTVRERREGRRVKRRLDAVSAPERYGREKVRRYEQKKEKRKERGGEARGRRRGW